MNIIKSRYWIKQKERREVMDLTKSKTMVKLAVAALEDKKAEDVKIIDITEVSVLADYFVIASGMNKNQVQALVDNVEETLGKAGYHSRQVEGYQSANWILLDYGDIIVHVFDAENRLFYDLERIWRDGKFITADELS
ncbi:iojap-like protein [Marvinbryantia formatexigens DSM 14469]|uniref:Ribosomal silencing factor RsfS n=2 Tax=Marvinbryantia TaxID=248744 RepID=C6LC75_9FIRM|nr:ribosome silencing factor [Marvinbryantia formatexigens]EET61539.1 iojap-like protein [Marvinbryantia formatexigens DSM 14469]